MKKSRKGGKRRFADDNLEIYSKIRKPLPPPAQVMKTGKEYNRRDKSWKEVD